MTIARPNAPINYPQPPDSGIVDDFHGTSVFDPYRYLEDPNDARTTEWLQAQAQLMDTERNSWTSRKFFVDRVGELLGSGAISPPYIRGERTFFTKREPGQQFAILYVRDTNDSHTNPQSARVLIDPMAMDPEGHTTLDSWQPSKEGDLLAYQISQGGNEESDVYVMNVKTGETIEGPDRSLPIFTNCLAQRRIGFLLCPPDSARSAARKRAPFSPPSLFAYAGCGSTN